MRTRLLSMGAIILATAALCACGGGGGGGGTPPPPPPPPTATPTVNPFGCVGSTPFAVVQRRALISPPHPIAPGDSFTYNGSVQTTYTQSAPCAQPAVSATAPATVTVTDFATTGPGGATTDQRSVETDNYPTVSTTTTTDAALSQTSSALLLHQLASSDSANDSLVTTYVNPQVMDELPEASQSWGGNATNNPAATMKETLSDGTSASRTVTADGSYTDTETFPGGSTALITVNGAINSHALDGSGTYTVGGNTFAYSPPSGGTITLTITGGANKSRTYPAWFNVPASYVTDNFTETLNQAIDPNCGANSAGAQSGNQIVETAVTLDPVLGYQETRTTTSYVVNGFGAVCVKIDDTLNSFYDYQSDTTKIDYQSQNGQPNSVAHDVEYLTMTAPAQPGYTQVRRQSQGVSPMLVAARVAAIEHKREIERAKTIERIYRRVIQAKNEGQLP